MEANDTTNNHRADWERELRQLEATGLGDTEPAREIRAHLASTPNRLVLPLSGSDSQWVFDQVLAFAEGWMGDDASLLARAIAHYVTTVRRSVGYQDLIEVILGQMNRNGATFALGWGDGYGTNPSQVRYGLVRSES